MPALGRFELLTFDCYGTLIDWEKGIVAAIKPLLKKYCKKPPTPRELLESYSVFEETLEKGPYRPYKEILEAIIANFGEKYQFKPTEDEAKVLVKSLPTWPTFYDSVYGLKRLKGRFKLAVLSNTDRDLFAHTQKQLEADFNWVVTSEDVQSYKPAVKHFEEILKQSGIPAEKILHVAQSLYHDVRPAKSMGIKTVWINRRRGLSAASAAPKANPHKDDKPDLELPDLDTFVDYIYHLMSL